MKIIQASTKEGQAMLNNANHNEGKYLSDIYLNYSGKKIGSFWHCMNLCDRENGKNFHIFSHNKCSFSVAWEVNNGIRIITPQNSYLIVY